jgi:hypothetical protein
MYRDACLLEALQLSLVQRCNGLEDRGYAVECPLAAAPLVTKFGHSCASVCVRENLTSRHSLSLRAGSHFSIGGVTG